MATRALPSDYLKTPVCERLGIDYPVFQAGMGGKWFEASCGRPEK